MLWQNLYIIKAKAKQTLSISKLIMIIHFVVRHNLPVKQFYHPLIKFLIFELEEPVLKQYFETFPKNATHDYHESCNEKISSINDYLKKPTDEKMLKAADIVIFSV